MSMQEPTDRLTEAKRHAPFVQANLIAMSEYDHAMVQRADPGSPDDLRLRGEPDDFGRERVHRHALAQFADLSDIQEERPNSLPEREIEVHR
jgi:anaerobic magnesium-protoporphyrin IX monomethyl ester cyclase